MKRRVISAVAVLAVAGAIGLLIYQPDWTGFGPDSTTSTERNAEDQIIKTIETEQSGKTLWDWLSVLGVPFSLAVLGFWLQRWEQKRTDEQAQLEKEIAESNQREEALQVYLDRLSTLLVDKNLIAIAARVNQTGEIQEKQQDTEVDEQKELLNAAVDVIRARTLSVLRQLGQDGEREKDRERRSSVIRFLIEAEVISKLELDLSGADLSSANLIDTNLSNAKLNNANLKGANLINTNLSSANLDGANLNGASLSSADLKSASLINATLVGATLSGTKLVNANLRGADLTNANLKGVNFTGSSLINASLRDTRLIGADFRDSSLNGAVLNDADLNGASLIEANLVGTKLVGAKLNRADLSSVINWTERQLSSAKLCQTKLPEGCRLDPDRDCKEIGMLTPT